MKIYGRNAEIIDQWFCFIVMLYYTKKFPVLRCSNRKIQKHKCSAYWFNLIITFDMSSVTAKS